MIPCDWAVQRFASHILRAMGFWMSQHEEIGCDIPPPSMRTSGDSAKGVSQQYLCDTTLKQGKKRATLRCDLEKVLRDMGPWAA